MLENTNSTDENSSVIETAIGPLDMREVVEDYGKQEDEVIKKASIAADLPTDMENGKSQDQKIEESLELQEKEDENSEKDSDGKNEEKETAQLGQEKFPLPLNVYGTSVELTMEEATRAVQRGLAFDKVKEDLATAKNDERLLLLAEIAKDTGKTSSQLLAKLQSDCLLENLEREYGEIENAPQEKIAEAVEKISRLEKRTQQIPVKEKEFAARQQLAEFYGQNPTVKEIPDEVLSATKKGMSLSKAYDLYRIEALENSLQEMSHKFKLAEQEKTAKQKEVPPLSGEGSSYSMGEEDVYAFFKKMW